ncbi:rRNA-processing protein CGR1 [Malassezia restricta]|uniref:rRNA-processing protein CGR1 n=1 Tax=Malassezia restricta TaxID=76775 RepID=UPI000DD1044B|nr:rRNA-processing protein CGR1 [Malassezia restricta]AXA48737.1 rRNA-processing protein CGR1 [Malassezia restricta]
MSEKQDMKMSTLDIPREKTTSKKWNERMQHRQKMHSIKTREREMKQAKEEESERRSQVRKERAFKAAEKERLEAMAARMSAKKALRHARRMGRTKKVAH